MSSGQRPPEPCGSLEVAGKIINPSRLILAERNRPAALLYSSPAASLQTQLPALRDTAGSEPCKTGLHQGWGGSPKDSPKGRKDRAIVALLQHSSTEKAAEAVGIHPATLWRWLKQPKFQQALREARREAFSRSIARLQQASSAAAATLMRIMTDPEAPAGSRVRAAQCVVALSQKGFECEDLELRIAQLEKIAQKIDSPQNVAK